jgi:ADP-ribose pyrophosphatase
MKNTNAEPHVVLRGRRQVFENSRFHVFADHIADSQGNAVPDYLVVAPKLSSEDLITGITVLPIWNGNIVLLDTFRHAIGRRILEAPRGFVDASETPRDAASRELLEEAGLICPPERLVPLGSCSPEASTLAARIALFAAPDCESGTRSDEGEIGLGKCVVFPLADAPRLLREFFLEDVTTALCLHRYCMLREDS